MFGLGTQELLMIMALVIMVFGTGNLPQIGTSLGKGIRNFKEGIDKEKEDFKKSEFSNNSK